MRLPIQIRWLIFQTRSLQVWRYGGTSHVVDTQGSVINLLMSALSKWRLQVLEIPSESSMGPRTFGASCQCGTACSPHYEHWSVCEAGQSDLTPPESYSTPSSTFRATKQRQIQTGDELRGHTNARHGGVKFRRATPQGVIWRHEARGTPNPGGCWNLKCSFSVIFSVLNS